MVNDAITQRVDSWFLNIRILEYTNERRRKCSFLNRRSTSSPCATVFLDLLHLPVAMRPIARLLKDRRTKI